MVSIQVFEPALCCNTGVCGEDVDQALVEFTANLDAFRKQGVDITRHNLANDPDAFVRNPVVMDFLNATGSEGLPLILVDGVTVLTGKYPTSEMLSRYAGFTPKQSIPVTPAGQQGCCGGTPSKCC